jgi:hypothetical protein
MPADLLLHIVELAADLSYEARHVVHVKSSLPGTLKPLGWGSPCIMRPE